MYFRGTLSIDLEGTQVDLLPPKHFFGGIANLMTKGAWAEKVHQENFKLMALAQSINRALRDCGVDNVIRLAIGDTIIYEDTNNVANDFELAMESFRHKVDEGLELGYLEEFDMILEHDDGKLKYVIDLDIYRQYRPGREPILITVTALSSELRLDPQESDEDFRKRVEQHFPTSEAFHDFQRQLEDQFRQFLGHLEAGCKKQLGVEAIKKESETRLVKESSEVQSWDPHTAYGRAFYGYGAATDLAYIALWGSLAGQHTETGERFTYVDADGETLIPTGAGLTEGSAAGGGSLLATDSGASSGGGGFLDSIGDLFGDSGGGGSIGGDSGCGSDGGGGGCGGCGS